MANVIQAQYETLDQIIRHFSAQTDETNRLIQTIHRQKDIVQRSAWVGKGADAFYGEMEGELFPALNRLAKALADAESATKRIVKTFRDAEDEAAKLFEGRSEMLLAMLTQITPQPAQKPQQGDPKPPKNDNERQIQDLRDEIKAAAAILGVSPELVAAIIYDELQKKDNNDNLQEWAALFGIGVKDTWSLGVAQMQIQTVYDLVEAGYLVKPDGWNDNKQDIAIRWLLEPKNAPYLVAARIKQTMDYWQQRGVDISQRPEILATLYSIGLTGQSGVNPNPQPSDRGNEIVGTMGRMGELLNGGE
ncbi:MAG: hypothetical protein OHK0023_01280 [Anaerolineae bacterium]